MNPYKPSLIIGAVLAFSLAMPGRAISDESISAVAGRVLPAIVTVKAKVPIETPAAGDAPASQGSGNGNESEITGAGFLVSADGIVVTAASTVTGNDALSIVLQDGKKLPAEMIGSDAITGIAVLKIEAKTQLPFLHFTNRTPGPGEIEIAIGSPGGFGGSIRAATVTSISKPSDPIPFIEFRAALLNGDPGGVLVDASGGVLGVISFLQAGAGNVGELGYALPGRIAEAAIKLLTTQGQVANRDVLLATAVPPANEPAPATFEPLGPPSAVSERVGQALVTVEGRHRAKGVVVSSDGYAVTTLDAVGSQKRVRVRLGNGTGAQAEVVGFDGLTDIALLRIKGSAPLPFAAMSEAPARPGQDVFASVGQANDLDIRAGVVSATGRFDGRHLHDVLQSDIQIDERGNGSGLFDKDGKLLGVLLESVAYPKNPARISFALPAATVDSVIAKLKQNGQIDRGWVGLNIRDGNDGAEVVSVKPGSPAEQAGLRQGDLIVGVDGTSVKAAHVVARIVADHTPGATLHINVVRSSEPLTLELAVGEHPK